MSRTALLSAAVALLLAASAVAAPLQPYHVTYINTFDETNAAKDISDNGRYVCGYYLEGGTGMAYRAFLYDTTDGSVTDLSPLIENEIGDARSLGLGVNDAGQVVGQAYYNDGTAQRSTGFLYDHVTQTVTRLELAGSDEGAATDINNAGEVVGYSHAPAYQAYFWDGTAHVLPGLPGQTDSHFAYGLSDQKHIAGSAYQAGGQHVAYWDAPGTIESANLGYGMANDVNELGELCGYTLSTAGAFLHDTTSGSTTDLGALLEDLATANGRSYFLSEADGINDLSQVVGQSQETSSTGYHAYLYHTNGQVYDLDDLTDASGDVWSLSYAFGVNNHGHIVGSGKLDGHPLYGRAYLLTPVPEPTSAVLLAACGLMALRRRSGGGHAG